MEHVGMRRSAVIALVEGQSLEGAGKYPAQGMPIVQRTQQAMENDKGFTGSILLKMKIHRLWILPRHSRGEGNVGLSLLLPGV